MPLGLVVIVCLFGSFIRGLNMPHFVSIFAFVSLPIIRRNRLPFWLVYWRAWYASFVLFVFAFVSLPSIRIRYIDCRIRIRVFVTDCHIRFVILHRRITVDLPRFLRVRLEGPHIVCLGDSNIVSDIVTSSGVSGKRQTSCYWPSGPCGHRIYLIESLSSSLSFFVVIAVSSSLSFFVIIAVVLF